MVLHRPIESTRLIVHLEPKAHVTEQTHLLCVFSTLTLFHKYVLWKQDRVVVTLLRTKCSKGASRCQGAYS
jgi:hypothetical protein